ncbi:hypothetical protein [Asticcacaulis taihuensis]|uniref:Uncharacterized protein n=1 Tax=Asticcacaulis taihuensis TaxID=260084 RepID=A0A1G4SG37_9CAUL|nr:hypothetical protein [Asticcacaulis taihuensis]SCW67535.1 hypothetical protein SAMN02927928_2620 [Asticcacaulis taihuensis]
MARKAAIVLGHSHLSAIVNCLVDRPGDPAPDDECIEYYIFDTVRMGADFQFSIPGSSGGLILNPAIFDMIRSKVPADRDLIYISMFGGNAHNALTLLEHPRPFDFILPEAPDLPRIAGAELVPADYIAAFLLRLAYRYILNAETLRNATDRPVYHLESPPPIGDDKFVTSHLEQYFRDQTTEAEPKIAPRILRYKLWRLHSRIIQGASESRNITFVASPPEAQDDEGFLRPEGYGNDSTHAGPGYADLCLRQFEKMLGLRYSGWNWLY